MKIPGLSSKYGGAVRAACDKAKQLSPVFRAKAVFKKIVPYHDGYGIV